jgi:hypothetical protein
MYVQAHGHGWQGVAEVIDRMLTPAGVGSAWMENLGESRTTRWVVPVVAERLRVDPRPVTVRTVRVAKRTRHREVVVENRAREEVHVRRVPAAQSSTGPYPTDT